MQNDFYSVKELLPQRNQADFVALQLAAFGSLIRALCVCFNWTARLGRLCAVSSGRVDTDANGDITLGQRRSFDTALLQDHRHRREGLNGWLWLRQETCGPPSSKRGSVPKFIWRDESVSARCGRHPRRKSMGEGPARLGCHNAY